MIRPGLVRLVFYGLVGGFILHDYGTLGGETRLLAGEGARGLVLPQGQSADTREPHGGAGETLYTKTVLYTLSYIYISAKLL